MDKSRVEPTIVFKEKISFSLKLFSGHFYGQSFIKTVRGPLPANEILVQVAYEQNHSVIFRGSKGNCFDMSLLLHQYFVPVSIRL